MTVDIVIPTYNEERTLETCVRALREYLADAPFEARITIADNASTDQTPVIADRLAAGDPDLRVVHVAVKGRGIALKTAWRSSDADVLVYMDVDLSTNLNALLPLVAPLLSGHSDLAIGTRLARNARVIRGSKRELISRGYNLLLRGTLGTGFGDAQCGFKAIRADAARWLLPLVQDDGWFFDTELLVLAERAGLRIYQVPVDWVDDPDSRVDLVPTAVEDLKGIARLGWNLSRGRVPLATMGSAVSVGRSSLASQVMRFLGVGVVSTVAYALVFLLLRGHLGAGSANVLALVSTTFFNTAANRLWTFGVRGRLRAARHQAQGLVVLAAGLAVTTLALSLSYDAGIHGRTQELAVLTAANLLVTVGRFVAFRHWVFRAPRGREPASAAGVGRRLESLGPGPGIGAVVAGEAGLPQLQRAECVDHDR
jgi:glycosyltransferase involved in cell wall biosynthesis